MKQDLVLIFSSVQSDRFQGKELEYIDYFVNTTLIFSYFVLFKFHFKLC